MTYQKLLWDVKKEKWMTCGCGGKPKEEAKLPAGSVSLWVKRNGLLTGPVTGFNYSIAPNQVSVDIDKLDADIWLLDGTAEKLIAPFSGKTGRTTRV